MPGRGKLVAPAIPRVGNHIHNPLCSGSQGENGKNRLRKMSPPYQTASKGVHCKVHTTTCVDTPSTTLVPTRKQHGCIVHYLGTVDWASIFSIFFLCSFISQTHGNVIIICVFCLVVCFPCFAPSIHYQATDIKTAFWASHQTPITSTHNATRIISAHSFSPTRTAAS